MAGSGNTQVIGGKSYTMYSPEWYAAQDANQVHESTVAGQAAGAGAGAAIKSQYETQFPGYQTPPPGAMNDGASALAALSGRAAGGSGGGSGGAGGGSYQPATAVSSRLLHELETAATAPMNPATAGAATMGSAPAVSYEGSTGTEAAARAATFARTKDNAANTASASLNGLSEALGARGMQGGGYEAGQVGQTLAREANTIGEGDRQEAESENARAADVADKEYAGKVAQRGQDLAAKNAENQMQMQQAQLAVQQRQTSLAGLEAALSASSRGVY